MNDPHASYLVTIVAGEFTELEATAQIKGGESIPLSYLVPKGREDDAKRTFARTPEMISWFSELLAKKSFFGVIRFAGTVMLCMRSISSSRGR